MTVDARVRANRLNAQRSTGPKSAAGKRRAARNAFRHGLAIPIARVPEAQQAVDVLTRLIAGDQCSERSLHLARRIAEAEIDLDRIRSVDSALIAQSFARTPIPHKDGKASGDDRARCGIATTIEEAEGDVALHLLGLDSEERLAIAIANVAHQHARLDRYKRRALSRRRLAMSAFEGESSANAKLD